MAFPLLQWGLSRSPRDTANSVFLQDSRSELDALIRAGGAPGKVLCAGVLPHTRLASLGAASVGEEVEMENQASGGHLKSTFQP